MTTRLGEALREAAEEIEGYDVLAGAVARGRRRRRWSAAASALAVLAVLALVTSMAVPWLPGSAPVAESPGAPTIPERIGLPAPFTRDPSASPPGAASLIFSPSRPGDVATVGAVDDTYRVIGGDAMAGRDALLSPTGDRVAYARDRELSIVDLVHGGTRTYGPGGEVDAFAPAAWLPDGSGLVVLATTYADDPTTQGTSKRLSILDLDTGALDHFAEATWPIATPGFAVAVSPDGNRIAYQFSDFITVYERDTGAKIRLDMPSWYFALAGRSAWAPDGSLALIYNDMAGDARTWQLRLIDPATGAHRTTLRTVGDRTVIRLVGWAGGDPVVVGYDGGVSSIGYGAGNLVLGGFEGMVGVYQLSVAGPRTLVRPVEGISHIDVAEALLADPHTRPGDPPWSFSLWWLLVVLALVGAGFGGAVRLRNRTAGGVTPPAGDRGRS